MTGQNSRESIEGQNVGPWHRRVGDGIHVISYLGCICNVKLPDATTDSASFARNKVKGQLSDFYTSASK